MNPKRAIAVVVTALVVAVVANAALAAPDASKPLTGTWSGKTHQDLEPLGPDADFVEWEQRITVQAFRGRLSSLATNVRYTCPDPTNPRAGDIRLFLSWSLLKNDGPKLTKNGGFALTITHVKDATGREVRLPVPVHIAGVLGKGSGGGRFDMSGGGCSGKGSWRVRRTSRI
jgi:hypothetical protein